MRDFHELMKLFGGGQVRRFHAHPVNIHQTNMHHGARAAIVSSYISKIQLTSRDLLYIIAHDCAEILTGDIPSPAKRNHKELKKFSDRIHEDFISNCGLGISTDGFAILKIADYLETMLYCCEERELGNTRMSQVFKNCLNYVERKRATAPVNQERVDEFIEHLSERFIGQLRMNEEAYFSNEFTMWERL